MPVRFHDEGASVRTIAEAARAAPFDGVMAVGDRPTVLAALAAEALGLPGNPPTPPARRPASSNRGGASPPPAWRRRGSALVARNEAAERLREPGCRFPCVVKPLGLSGSRGVMRCDDDGQSPRRSAVCARCWRGWTSARTAMRLTTTWSGRGVHRRGASTRSKACYGRAAAALAIFDKPDPLDGPFFEETIYVTPSAARCGGAGRPCRCRAARGRGAGVGARSGPRRMPRRPSRGRGAGGRRRGRSAGCARGSCRFAAPGDDVGERSLEELLLRHAIGEDVSGWQRERAAAAVMMIPDSEARSLQGCDGRGAARGVPGVEEVRITAKRDQLLEPLPEAGSYLGFIFARGADRA